MRGEIFGRGFDYRRLHQQKSTCNSKCFFQFYSPCGEFYCFAVIYGFQPSVIALWQLKKRIEYHFCESKNITPNKVRYITKNNENAAACGLKSTSNSVGRWLAAAVKSQQINGYKTVIFLYYIVGANCVRPFLICYELAGDRRSPLRVVRNFLMSY